MERYKMKPADAFSRLAEVSQTTNTKLFMVASKLADTGEWPHELA
jgi:hypothetical protein